MKPVGGRAFGTKKHYLWQVYYSQGSMVFQWQRIHLPMHKMRVRSLGQEDPLKKGMATHSSVLAWEILCTEEPDRLQFMELQRAGHDLVTKQQQYYSQCEDSEVFG